MSLAFDEGLDAAERGDDKSSNPYSDDSPEYLEWNDGFDWYTNGGV